MMNLSINLLAEINKCLNSSLAQCNKNTWKKCDMYIIIDAVDDEFPPE